MFNMNLILASSSTYRAKLLRQLRLKAQSIAPNIEEKPVNGEDPKQLATRLAAEKAAAVITQIGRLEEPSIVIASDQVAYCNHKMLGKPHTAENAIAQLTDMSNKTAEFYTSLFMQNTQTQQTFTHLDVTKVNFRTLTSQEIKSYVALESPFDCAGSFKCEGLGISLFNSIETHDPSALVGLPLISVTKGLINLGLNPLLIGNAE